ncbi:hypothetical protein ElyMa_002217500 [Elysia marginata]|uniref:Transposase DDE domain-containing protein n=1 Tax=Elysia marginata TaxID=1093978 RepID=A0AAV4FSY7_9GAST|nr:hypothetical protein ElyMa_002217500 [Elysia marginata]
MRFADQPVSRDFLQRLAEVALTAARRCFFGRRFVINIDGSLIASIEKMRARWLSREIKQQDFFFGGRGEAIQIGALCVGISRACKKGATPAVTSFTKSKMQQRQCI